jgi:phage tail-like protein
MTDDGSARASVWPLPKFYFSVDIAGVGAGLQFQEVSGLESGTKVIDYRQGGGKAFSPIKMPGIAKSANVTLKKGVVARDSKFWDWLAQFKMNSIARTAVTIKLMDEGGKPTMTWTLTNAWPTKFTGADLKADGSEIAIESLEIAHEGVTIVDS